MRSITGSNGFISCAESRTATSCSLATRSRSLDDLLAAADVEVGQRLVEQQELRPADQGVGDQDALLLATGQVARRGRRRSARRRRRASISSTSRGALGRAAAARRSGARRGRGPPGHAPAAGSPGRRTPSAGRSRSTGCAAHAAAVDEHPARARPLEAEDRLGAAWSCRRRSSRSGR